MSRNRFIDYLKGIAIFIVVWAHGIQYLNKDYNFSVNPVYLFIYAFHMPMFMAISGYLAAYSWKRKEFEVMLNIKFRQLIIPVLCWAVIMTFIFFYKEIFSRDLLPGLLLYLRSYISILPYYLWFLWALFVISILVYFVSAKLNDRIIIHGCIFLVLFFLTDKYGLIYIKYMYPYFIFGYFGNLNTDKLLRFKKMVTAVSFLIFPVLLFFWSKQDLIYHNEMSVYSTDLYYSLVTAIKRYLIGFTGTIVVVTIFKEVLYFPTAKFITKMGVFSLGIYIMQTVIYAVVDIVIPVYEVNIYVYTFIYTLLGSALVIIVSIFFTKWISKIPVIGKALFGGRY